MLWTRSLLFRLLAPYLVALAIIASGLYLYGDRAVRSLYLSTLSESALHNARLVGELLPWDLQGPDLDRRCAALGDVIHARITVIGVDGTVLGDSNVPSSELESHRDRPEVSAALLHGSGSDLRLSQSVHRELFYRAWMQSRDDMQRVIRVALPLSAVESTLARIHTALWMAIGVAAFAVLVPGWMISRRLSRRVLRLASFSSAVAQGWEVTPPLEPESEDAVGELEVNLTRMAETLKARLEAVGQEKEKLEAVLAGMVEGVLVVDRDGTVQLSNRRAESLLGVSPGTNLEGRPLLSITRDPDLQELMRAVVEARPGEAVMRELTLEGGVREHMQVSATAIGPPGAEPQTFILVFHDITELKRLEAMRRDFVANVSHELRTPLTAIRGYAETLRGGVLADGATAVRFVDIIERNAERLSRLIEDLSALSDLELGRAELQLRSVAVPAVVNAAVDVVRTKAQEGGIRLSVEIAEELPRVVADADRLEQVLVNLLDNAVKYTPRDGNVTVLARESPPPDGKTGGQRTWLELCVVDDGIGIPSQDVPRLTERFYRVDKARSRELGGTGLGLAIVKHIVQAHAGVLRIESELGRGTRVFVYLPMNEAAAAA